MLTGRCKNDFDSYFYKGTHLDYTGLELMNTGNSSPLDVFEELPFSAQWGVYVDFFDVNSLNLFLTVDFDFGYEIYSGRYEQEETCKKWFETRDEARTACLKKANEIYNDKHFVFPNDLAKEPKQ